MTSPSKDEELIDVMAKQLYGHLFAECSDEEKRNLIMVSGKLWDKKKAEPDGGE